jgi:lipopolysaccharide/colanic/teichoic acid biosynthesis glycosyltransferase
MKRAVDLLVSSLVLLLGAPVFGLLGVCVILDSGRPIFFKQLRVGRGGRNFWLWKFRSMRMSSAGPSITVAGDRRVTRIGRILRASKLDELPQFWNVFRGDMSLVGPRPEVSEFVEIFRERYERVLTVRPGMTDLASIQYRDEEGILAQSDNPQAEYVRKILPAKLDLAEDYIRRQSFWLDAKILLKTFWAVIPRRSYSNRVKKG